MGLFQRNLFNEDTPLYTTAIDVAQYGSSLDGKVLLIVALGNVGKKYDGTRHNIGFAAVDHFAAQQGFPAWTTQKDRKCAETSHKLGASQVILCKPTTFMNNSGEAVQAMQHFYKIPNSQTFVVHDELDINFGQIRLRKGGSAAGHNGIKSLIDRCGEDFGRMRIGVGPKQPGEIESSDFVLAKFSPEETKDQGDLLKESGSMLNDYAYNKGEFLEETRSFII